MARQISCERVHELLSEYIDGSLEPHLSDIIDNHLLTCGRCTEELHSLNKVVNALKSLEEVKAPENFLEHVHERIKPVTFVDKVFKKIHFAFEEIHTFFTYGHMKLTFQTIAVVVVVFATIFSVREIIKQPSHLPLESEETETVRLSEKEIPEPTRDEKIYTAKSNREDFLLEKNEYKKGHVITIALLIKDKKLDISHSRGFEKQREAGKKKIPSSAHEGFSMRDNVQHKPLKQRSQSFEDRIIESDREEQKLEEVQIGGVISKDEASLSTLTDALAKTKKIIKSVDGTVTSFSLHDEQLKEPLFIEAIIPTQNFSQFTEKLRLIGILRDPLPPIQYQVDSSVSVVVQFYFSQKK